MPHVAGERMALGAVAVVATGAGVAAGLGAVPGPAMLCITPFGTATSGPSCDPQQVSATLAMVAGVLSAVVAGMLAMAVAAIVLSALARSAEEQQPVGE